MNSIHVDYLQTILNVLHLILIYFKTIVTTPVRNNWNLNQLKRVLATRETVVQLLKNLLTPVYPSKLFFINCELTNLTRLFRDMPVSNIQMRGNHDEEWVLAEMCQQQHLYL